MEEVDINIIYQTIKEKIKCRKNEIIQDVLERFSDVYDKNAEDFIFLFEGIPLDRDSTIEDLFKGKYDKPILAVDLVNSTTQIEENEVNEVTIIYSIKKKKTI